jgi:hypothetical protein
MTEEQLKATISISAPAQAVFGVLADPSTHAAVDGTGWVRESLDGKPITAAGQVFRMAMYFNNPDQPSNHYEVANLVEVFDPPRAIAWKPGQGADNANLEFGGWIWRYDLEPVGPSETKVTLTYDWSAVPPQIRERIGFPPFDPQHLDNSLKHLAELADIRPAVS